MQDNIKDSEVPDHVFLGLMLGAIKGPLKYLPNIKAEVSLRKDVNKIIKIKFLSTFRI